jgi:hypothetical protein
MAMACNCWLHIAVQQHLLQVTLMTFLLVAVGQMMQVVGCWVLPVLLLCSGVQQPALQCHRYLAQSQAAATPAAPAAAAAPATAAARAIAAAAMPHSLRPREGVAVPRFH